MNIFYGDKSEKPIPPIAPPELRCIETIAPPGQWVVQIGTKKVNLDYLQKPDVWNRRHRLRVFNSIIMQQRLQQHIYSRDFMWFYRKIDADPVGEFDYMRDECLNNPNLIPGLARHISGRSMDLLSQYIFNNKEDIDEEFITMFYAEFLPCYFRRRYTWCALDLLVRASVASPSNFKYLLRGLLWDDQIRNDILYDFVSRLTKEKKTEVMDLLTMFNLNEEQFLKNLRVLCCLYADCERTESMCNYIIIHLEFHAWACTNSKDYGKLLLVYMKNSTSDRARSRTVRKLLDIHGSPYKGACMSVLEDFASELMLLQHRLRPVLARFTIPADPVPSWL